MADASEDSLRLQAWLDRLRAGDGGAFEGLIGHSLERLRRLARKMLRGYPAVHRWEQTDDVLQNALLRLRKALAQVKPETPRQFFGLAATYLRRELIDLARHYYGPEGMGAHHASHGADPEAAGRRLEEAVDDSHEPARLAEWGEFHRQVEALPEEERETFNLLWYHDLSQAEAAALLQVSERTIKRRWRSARLLLHRALRPDVP
jgi:RNA polymerase sigma-70 factor (ECF subfamily)